MKNLFLVSAMFLAFTATYAQCNLSITNNTGDAIDLFAIEADQYNCGATGVNNVPSVFIAPNSTVSVSHVSYSHWIGVHVYQINGNTVNLGYPNYLATGCLQRTSGPVSITWVNNCSIDIN